MPTAPPGATIECRPGHRPERREDRFEMFRVLVGGVDLIDARIRAAGHTDVAVGPALPAPVDHFEGVLLALLEDVPRCPEKPVPRTSTTIWV